MTTKALCLSSFAWLASVALASGCTLARNVSGTVDTGPITRDAFVPGHDGGAPRDTGLDAFVPPIDTGVDAFAPPLDSGTDAYVSPVDAYVSPVDAYVPPVDAWSAPDAWVQPTDAWVPPAFDASTPCDRAYGGAPGYAPCGGTTAATCVFYLNWPGSSTNDCNHVCGGRCVGGIDNAAGTMCSPTGGAFACNRAFQTGICTCTP